MDNGRIVPVKVTEAEGYVVQNGGFPLHTDVGLLHVVC